MAETATEGSAGHVLQWVADRGWKKSWLQFVPTWDKDATTGWELYAKPEGWGAPLLLASVRGPVGGIFEEVIALENVHPEWCAWAKEELAEE